MLNRDVTTDDLPGPRALPEWALDPLRVRRIERVWLRRLGTGNRRGPNGDSRRLG